MRVLVAVDDSKFSEAALEAVMSQFRPEKTQVRVLHVLQPISITTPPQMSRDYAPELASQKEWGNALVERGAKPLRAAGFKVDTEVEHGDARLKIIDCAAEWKADLIVLGSHGRGPVQRFLLGSVAEFVARNARCSVEIVRVGLSK